MKKTHFVVTETNFEYNDEYHTVTDGGGGKPVAVFEDEEEARKETQKRNIKALRDYGSDILTGMIYANGFDYVFDNTPSFMDGDLFDEDDIEGFLSINTRPNNQLEEIESCLRVKFFTYTKV
jgi:hypothetical protein